MTLRCIVCRTRRATLAAMAEHQQSSGHRRPCTCGGYHYAHRPGSPMCEANSWVNYNRARREGLRGDDLLDAWLEDALFGHHTPPKDQTCPF